MQKDRHKLMENQVIQGVYSSAPNLWQGDEKLSKYVLGLCFLSVVGAVGLICSYETQAEIAKAQRLNDLKNGLLKNIDDAHYISSKKLMREIVLQNKECVKIMVSNGADLNRGLYNGITPLMCAAMFGDVEMVEMLIKNGAVISQKDSQGRTALDFAHSTDNDKVVKFLQKKMAETRQAAPVKIMFQSVCTPYIKLIVQNGNQVHSRS